MKRVKQKLECEMTPYLLVGENT